MCRSSIQVVSHLLYCHCPFFRYSVIPIDVNLYTSRSDHVRLGFELVYLVMVLLGVFSEALDALKVNCESFL